MSKTMDKKIRPELVIAGIQAGAALAERLIEAIVNGDDHVWKPIAQIIPDPLKSRLTLEASKQKLISDFEAGRS